MVEVGLVDGGAGEAVLDVDIDVILAQGELRFLAVGIDGDQGAAGVLAGGHQRRFGGGHQVARPVEQVRGRGAAVCLSLGRELLAGADRLVQAIDGNPAASHHDICAVFRHADGEGPDRSGQLGAAA